MNRYELAPRVLLLWRIRLLICFFLFTAVCVSFIFIFPIVSIIIACTTIPVSLWLWFWYLPKLHSLYSFTVSDDAVVLTRGVFIIRQYLMPCPRLIFAERFTTPLASLMGLCSLRLRASRGRLTLPPMLSDETADIMVRLGNDYICNSRF